MDRARFLLSALFVFSSVALAQISPTVAALGDSIGEGVQSADATTRTQPYQFSNLIAQQFGLPFTQPLIDGGVLTNIFSTQGRTRVDPSLVANNVAVSGATIHDLLNATYVPPTDTETDLVLQPESLTQIQRAEAQHAELNVVWIGSNDVDGAVLDWTHLDASQLTPVDSFTADYADMVNRLKALSGRTVVGTIPDVTQIGFVFSPQDMTLFLGTDCGLPSGSYTTAPAALLIRLGVYDCSLLQDPNYVLDPTEIATIRDRLLTFNQIITSDANQAGMAVADIYTTFISYLTNPPVFYGVPLTPRFNGGLLSLDGVHPSNIGHALAANLFIQAYNQTWGSNIPLISQDALNSIAASDPFIDWDGNLIVRGRPLAGLLETLGPFVGISGDYRDHPNTARVAPSGKIDKKLGEQFMQQYLAIKGLPASTQWTKADAINAMKMIFGH
jgi:lysophospholipase L1-like esterase